MKNFCLHSLLGALFITLFSGSFMPASASSEAGASSSSGAFAQPQSLYEEGNQQIISFEYALVKVCFYSQQNDISEEQKAKIVEWVKGQPYTFSMIFNRLVFRYLVSEDTSAFFSPFGYLQHEVVFFDGPNPQKIFYKLFLLLREIIRGVLAEQKHVKVNLYDGPLLHNDSFYGYEELLEAKSKGIQLDSPLILTRKEQDKRAALFMSASLPAYCDYQDKRYYFFYSEEFTASTTVNKLIPESENISGIGAKRPRDESSASALSSAVSSAGEASLPSASKVAARGEGACSKVVEQILAKVDNSTEEAAASAGASY